jgi:hypothetical protein
VFRLFCTIAKHVDLAFIKAVAFEQGLEQQSRVLRTIIGKDGNGGFIQHLINIQSGQWRNSLSRFIYLEHLLRIS